MKKLIIILQVVWLSHAVLTAQTTDTGLTELKIKTTAQCSLCKDRIERALAFEKGVKSSNLDVETKVLTVVYKNGKTTNEKIRLAITQLGYDADGLKKDEKAYKNLPACCKLPDDPERQVH